MELAVVDQSEPGTRFATDPHVLGDRHAGNEIQLLVNHRDPCQQGFRHAVLVADEREDRAVVVAVRVNVEEIRRARKRLCQRGDRRAVATV